MTLRGQNRIAAPGHLAVEWRRYVLASFGQNACPNTPSICLGMHLNGANGTRSTKSVELRFSDSRRNVQ